MKRYIAERPRILKGGNPLHALAAQFVEDLLNQRLTNRGVYGFYGPRGSGKTSFLLTLLDVMAKRGATGTQVPLFVLPREGIHSPGTRELFAPAQTRDHDDLLFDLLRYLRFSFGSRLAQEEAKEEPFAAAHKAEVQRKHINVVLDYDKETASSGEKLPDLLVKRHVEAADTTSALKKSLREIVEGIQGKHRERTVILPIDDLDLHAYRALELLQIFNLFLDQIPGLVILIAADQDLLRTSIAAGIAEKKVGMQLRDPGLAGALLAKWVPYTRLLPVPRDDDGLRFLFEDLELPEESNLQAQDKTFPSAPDLWAHAMPDLQKAEVNNIDWKHQYWDSILPTTYRGLAALHNRLVDAKGEQDRIEKDLAPTGLLERYRPPWFSLAQSIDVRFPETNFVEELRRQPNRVVTALTRLDGIQRKLRGVSDGGVPAQGSQAKDSSESWAREELSEIYQRFPFLKPSISARDQDALERAWERLYEAMAAFRALGALLPVGQKFLFISFFNDAVERFRGKVEGLFIDQLDQWHIKLQQFLGDKARPTPDDIVRARAEACRALRELKVPSYSGKLEMRAEAPLSFLMWLGWELRRVRPIVVYNFFAGQFVPFAGPANELRYQEKGAYGYFAEADDSNPAAEVKNEAIVLIDTLNRSTNDQLAAFVGANSKPIGAAKKVRLTGPRGSTLTQSDLVLILQDVIELVGRLRHYEGIQRFHLAFSSPDVVAFFVGQQLNAYPVSLYEYDQTAGVYRYVFALADDEVKSVA